MGVSWPVCFDSSSRKVLREEGEVIGVYVAGMWVAGGAEGGDEK
jgi:hypothetical protein